MGLWVSHRIVQLHGGHLRYAPGPGGGSSFTFTVPRSAAAHPSGAEAAVPHVPEPGDHDSRSLARYEGRIAELVDGLITLRRLLVQDGEWEPDSPADRLVSRLLREG